MNEQLKNIKINLLLLLRRFEELKYDVFDNEIEVKIKSMNDKVFELSDMLETIEVLLE